MPGKHACPIARASDRPPIGRVVMMVNKLIIAGNNQRRTVPIGNINAKIHDNTPATIDVRAAMMVNKVELNILFCTLEE